MDVRQKLFLAVFLFGALPAACAIRLGTFNRSEDIARLLVIGAFALLGAIAGLIKIDKILRQAERETARKEQERAFLLKAIHDGYFHIDLAGKILEVNPVMARFLRQEESSLRGKILWDFIDCPGGFPGPMFFSGIIGFKPLILTARSETDAGLPLQAEIYPWRQQDVLLGFRGFTRQIQAAAPASASAAPS